MSSDFGSLEQAAPLTMEPGKPVHSASAGAEPGRRWRSVLGVWVPVLLALAGILAALAVALVLWLVPLAGSTVQASSQLATRTAQLALALQLPPGVPRAHLVDESRTAIDGLLRRLLDQAGELEGLDEPLKSLQLDWTRLRPATGADPVADVTLEALRAQVLAAEALTADIERTREQRRQGRNLALGLAAMAAAGVILWGMLTLRRHRRQWRQAMQQFSSELGSGDWQDAVRSLRNERSGPPSAWDALASGVESVLGESDRRWRALADLAADWYWETDERHRLAWIAGAAPPIESQGWSIQRVMHRRYDQVEFFEAPSGGWRAVKTRLDSHEPLREVEFRILSAHGRDPVWVSISGRARWHDNGRFMGYEGVGRDVTERHLAEAQLRRSEQRWSTMAALASDNYWETDEEHRLLPMRPELQRRFGPHAQRFEGLTRWEAHREALSAEQWADHRADLEAHRPFRGLQLEVEVEPGRYLWMSLSGVPRFGSDGRFLGYHGVGRDITLRIQAEKLLMRHNEELQRKVDERTRELQAVNVELDAFARQLAHELRTPIGQVQGLAHLLEARAQARLNAEDRELLAAQVQAAHRMRETVDALLLLARSSMQAMPMETLDLSALARSIVESLPAVKRQAPVRWRIAPGMTVRAAPAPMRIVLENLLGNAAKFTRHLADPTVELALTHQAGQDELTVRDNGAGFDMAHADRLFKPFNRLHSHAQYDGVGIGLTIVQRIVERHGGSVGAEGKPGQGAVFTVRLPACGDPAHKPAAPEPAAKRSPPAH